jgi:hypothetical protein
MTPAAWYSNIQSYTRVGPGRVRVPLHTRVNFLVDIMQLACGEMGEAPAWPGT